MDLIDMFLWTKFFIIPNYKADDGLLIVLYVDFLEGDCF